MFLSHQPNSYLNPTKVSRDRYQALQTIFWSEQPGKPYFSADQWELLRWYLRQDRTEQPCFCQQEEPELKRFPATDEMINWTLGNLLFRLLRYDNAVRSGFVAAAPTHQPSAASP